MDTDALITAIAAIRQDPSLYEAGQARSHYQHTPQLEMAAAVIAYRKGRCGMDPKNFVWARGLSDDDLIDVMAAADRAVVEVAGHQAEQDAAVRVRHQKRQRAAAEREAAEARQQEREAAGDVPATPRQVGYLRSLLASEGHPDLMGIDPARMTKRAASRLISDIKSGEIG